MRRLKAWSEQSDAACAWGGLQVVENRRNGSGALPSANCVASARRPSPGRTTAAPAQRHITQIINDGGGIEASERFRGPQPMPPPSGSVAPPNGRLRLDAPLSCVIFDERLTAKSWRPARPR